MSDYNYKRLNTAMAKAKESDTLRDTKMWFPDKDGSEYLIATIIIVAVSGTTGITLMAGLSVLKGTATAVAIWVGIITVVYGVGRGLLWLDGKVHPPVKGK